MKTKLDELYEQRNDLQRQIHVLDSQIDNEKKAQEKKAYENLYNCYKKAFLKDIKIFNTKEDIQRVIEFGLELKTPHYNIYFKEDGDYWQAEIKDLHKDKYIVKESFYKQKVTTVKQTLDNLSETIVEYEFENEFKGVG